MILLDTDHFSVLTNSRHSAHGALSARLQASIEVCAITIVSIEEQCRGWLAKIRRLRAVHKQIAAYEQLARLIRFLNEWEVVLLDVSAADQFEHLRKERIRVGTQDLKIASIALAQGALLLSANLR